MTNQDFKEIEMIDKDIHKRRVGGLAVLFVGGLFAMAMMGNSKPSTKTTKGCECDCPDHWNRDRVEAQYESLIRPIYVEAVGFQGIVLRDSIGSAFVITNDKALHEILEYSYNVGDTIK